MSKNKKTYRKINKKTNRRNKTSRRNKTNRRNKTSRTIKLRFNKIGGNRECLDALKAKYGEVFWTGGITIQQIYDDALNIRRPDVIQLIRDIIEKINELLMKSYHGAPGRARLTDAICREIQKITDMLGEERSAIILRTTKRLCVNPKMGFLGSRNDHPRHNTTTKFLIEYLECLISIMEFSLLEPPGGGLVEDIRAGPVERPRAEAVEVLPRDPPVEWYFEGLEPRGAPRAEEPAAEPRAEEEIEEPAAGSVPVARQNA